MVGSLSLRNLCIKVCDDNTLQFISFPWDDTEITFTE